MDLIVSGDSAVGDSVYEYLLKTFHEMAISPGDPIVRTEGTSCVATLDFDWSDLVAEPLRHLAQGQILNLLSEKAPARAEIRGLHFAFRVAYPQVPQEIHDHGVTLSEKFLTIEPRVQTPLSERRYFTISPTDSATHFRLVEEVERCLRRNP